VWLSLFTVFSSARPVAVAVRSALIALAGVIFARWAITTDGCHLEVSAAMA
jgi:hypothetical protein